MSDPAAGQASALDVYGRGLLAAAHMPHAHSTVQAISDCGQRLPLALARYTGRPTAEEQTLLARAVGPVLDVGCGPARHVVALTLRGVEAVGVDLSPTAVRLARGRGARVIEGSVFDRLPGAGRWATVLLLDGNVGIGGRPEALLQRVAGLLRPDGIVLVEVEPGSIAASRLRVRLHDGHAASEWFAWGRVGSEDLARVAGAAGLLVRERWTAGGRTFAKLARRPGSARRAGGTDVGRTDAGDTDAGGTHAGDTNAGRTHA